MKQQKSLVAAIVIAFAMIAPSSWAGLDPGVFSYFVFESGFSGTILEDRTVSFTGTDAFGNVAFSGDIQLQVIEDGLGHMNFGYRMLSNNGPNAIHRMTLFDFTGFETDVFWDFHSDPASDTYVRPYFADRSVDGSVIGLDFVTHTPSRDLFGFLPGYESKFFWISTDATSYKEGTISLIDHGTVNFLGFAPGIPPGIPSVPEAGALLLFSTGIAGLVGYRRTRRMK